MYNHVLISPIIENRKKRNTLRLISRVSSPPKDSSETLKSEKYNCKKDFSNNLIKKKRKITLLTLRVKSSPLLNAYTFQKLSAKAFRF